MDKNSYPRDQKTKYSINIISAQQLPKPKSSEKGEVIDPYVQLKVHGPQIDSDFNLKNLHSQNKMMEKNCVLNNGFNPVFDQKFTIEVFLKELCMLEIQIFDQDIGQDDQIAQCFLPMEFIEEGFRTVSLYDKKGNDLKPANLLVEVSIDNKPPMKTDASACQIF